MNDSCIDPLICKQPYYEHHRRSVVSSFSVFVSFCLYEFQRSIPLFVSQAFIRFNLFFTLGKLALLDTMERFKEDFLRLKLVLTSGDEDSHLMRN